MVPLLPHKLRNVFVHSLHHRTFESVLGGFDSSMITNQMYKQTSTFYFSMVPLLQHIDL